MITIFINIKWGGVSTKVNLDRAGHRTLSHAQKKSPFGGYKHVNRAEAKICSCADDWDISKSGGY